METKKITENELKDILELKESFGNAYINIGSIEVKIKQLQSEKDQFFLALEDLQTKETTILTSLRQNYGDGIVDLTTGEFKSEK